MTFLQQPLKRGKNTHTRIRNLEEEKKSNKVPLHTQKKNYFYANVSILCYFCYYF